MPSVPSIHLQSMQAESMIEAARQLAEASGKQAVKRAGERFEKTATTFFKTTNDAFTKDFLITTEKGETKLNPQKPNIYSNAIIAFFSELRKAEKECPDIVRKPSKSLWDRIFTDGATVKEFFIEALENASNNNETLGKEVRKFFGRFEKFYPNSYQDRLNLARSGRVNTSGVPKQNAGEKVNLYLNKLVQDE